VSGPQQRPEILTGQVALERPAVGRAVSSGQFVWVEPGERIAVPEIR